MIDLKLVAYLQQAGHQLPPLQNSKGKSVDLINLKLVAYLQQDGHQLPQLQNYKGKSVDSIDLKLVVFSKLDSSFPRSRTPRVRVLT